jgi:hypothetical protein
VDKSRLQYCCGRCYLSGTVLTSNTWSPSQSSNKTFILRSEHDLNTVRREQIRYHGLQPRSVGGLLQALRAGNLHPRIFFSWDRFGLQYPPYRKLEQRPHCLTKTVCTLAFLVGDVNTERWLNAGGNVCTDIHEQREGMGLLEFQAMPSLHHLYICYITAAKNSISSQQGSSYPGNRYVTDKAGVTARPSYTKSHLPDHSPPANQAGRHIGSAL